MGRWQSPHAGWPQGTTADGLSCSCTSLGTVKARALCYLLLRHAHNPQHMIGLQGCNGTAQRANTKHASRTYQAQSLSRGGLSLPQLSTQVMRQQVCLSCP